MRAFELPPLDPFAHLPGTASAHNEFLPARVRLTASVTPLVLEGRARWNAAGGVDLCDETAGLDVLYASYPAHRVLRVDWLAEECAYFDESDPEREAHDVAA